MPVLDRTIDVSAARRPGVYVLRNRGRVVWVGAARNPLRRLYAHDVHRRGDRIPGLPSAPVVFDSIEIHPCTVDDLDAEHYRICTELAWAP